MTVPANTLRTKSGQAQKSVKSGAGSSSQANSPSESAVLFWRKPGFQTGAGTLVLFMTLVWLIALVSYAMTWRQDQSLFLEASWESLWSTDAEAQNWLGRLGAFLGHWTVYRGWGIAVVFFWFWFLLLGLKLLFANFRVKLVDRAFSSLFYASALSITLAYLFHACWTLPFPWGGAFGRFAVGWASGFVGLVGTGLGLAGFWFAWILIQRGQRLQWPTWRPRTTNQVKAPVPDPVVLPDPVALPDPVVLPDPTDLQTPEPIEQVSGIDAPVWLEPQEVRSEESTEDWATLGKIGDMEVALPEQEEELEDAHTVALTDSELYDHKLDLSGYRYPTLDLLSEYASGKFQINPAELEANKDQIVNTLRQYGIEIDKIKATVGPTVTLYEIIPAAGVRISKIKNLEDDIALSLAALGIRIIAPMPGKGTVGIEVPNQNKEVVGMRGLLASDRFVSSEMELPIALGKTIANEIFVADLTKMPHLLMAGATGQGKSVGINAILVSLLFKKHPSELKLVLVDPKKVELSLFRRIEKHFLACLPDAEDAIVTDTRQVVHTMNALGIEMDRRYDLLKNAQVRNLVEYNNKFRKRRLSPSAGHRYLPYIVVVIDEFADLIMTAGKEIEFPITRLAQLARAVGIHLIVATQRPSVNIITGTIKANFPARIAFKVSSKIDSRTIIDTGGAEQLIGRGDMLLSLSSNVVRLQCAFVDTPEVEAVCDFIGDQTGYASPFLLPEYKDPESEKESGSDGVGAVRDELFDEAARMVVQYQQGSTSLLQRRMTIGYARAGRLIDQLEAAGIVGRFEGSKPREVLYTDPHHLEEKLRQLKGL
ncbi:MAG: DNA translocase FtsK 4TM domain-containing protein [Bacteroidia bacterium]